MPTCAVAIGERHLSHLADLVEVTEVAEVGGLFVGESSASSGHALGVAGLVGQIPVTSSRWSRS